MSIVDQYHSLSNQLYSRTPQSISSFLPLQPPLCTSIFLFIVTDPMTSER